MNEVKLPPLPDPFVGLQHNSAWNSYEQVISSAIGEPHVISVFTEGQMQAYARSAIEADRQSTSEWRKLALQFDSQRMQAIGHLKAIVDHLPVDMQPHIRNFLSATPDRQARGEPVGNVSKDSAVAHMHVNLPEGAPVYAVPQPQQPGSEPVNEEELLAAREALIDMGYLWDGDQWLEVYPPSETVEQAPEWPDFALMEECLHRLKERLVFENSRRNDLEQKLRKKRNG